MTTDATFTNITCTTITGTVGNFNKINFLTITGFTGSSIQTTYLAATNVTGSLCSFNTGTITKFSVGTLTGSSLYSQDITRNGTITTTNRVLNSLSTNDISLTSSGTNQPVFFGNFQEVLFHDLSTNTGWTSDTTVSSQRDGTVNSYGVFNDSAAQNGYLNIQISSLPVGSYMVEYIFIRQPNTGKVTFFFKGNGNAGYTTIRSEWDSYSPLATQLDFRDFFTITNGGQTCDLRWQCLNKNTNATAYYVYLGGRVRVTKF